MSATLYVLFLSFCATQAPYHCREEARGEFRVPQDCYEAAAKFVEPGTAPIFDEEGRILDAALCRRVEKD